MNRADTAVELASFLVFMQGRGPMDASGLALAEVLASQYEYEATFLRQYPSCAKYHSPSWHVENNVPADRRVSLGTVRYRILDDGTLGPQQANFDSGD